MTVRFFQILIGVVLYFCSTPSGMAKETILEEKRAEIFATCEWGDEAEKPAAPVIEGVGLLPGVSATEQSESSVNNDFEAKRKLKRLVSRRIFLSNCRFSCFLSPKAQARGVARHPSTQNAKQERTATIRFLQLEALVC